MAFLDTPVILSMFLTVGQTNTGTERTCKLHRETSSTPHLRSFGLGKWNQSFCDAELIGRYVCLCMVLAKPASLTFLPKDGNFLFQKTKLAL